MDERRRAEVVVPSTGTWGVSWLLRDGFQVDGGRRSYPVRSATGLTTVELPADGSPIDVELAPDAADLARALRGLSGQ